MSDLDRLFEDMFSGTEGSEFPGFPGTTGTSGNDQAIDHNNVSRLSRISRSKNEGRRILRPTDPENSGFCSAAVARVETMCLDAGKSGKAGKSANDLAGSDTYHFPVPSSLPGKIEGFREIQGLPADTSPIPPATVRAAVERELRALAEDGGTGPDALRDAVAITTAKIRNSPALAERQAHDGRCHICGEPLDGGRPEVAVLQPKGSGHLWLHGGACHTEHMRRRAVLVERIMVRAGYGSAQPEPAP